MKMLKNGLKIFFVVLIAGLFARAWTIRPRVDVKPLVPAEEFHQVLHVTQFPGDADRFLATEKEGVVKWFKRSSSSADGVVLNIKDRVYSADQEAGLLSGILDPKFPQRPYLYVYYSLEKPLRDRIARYTVNDKMEADPKSEFIIKEWGKWGERHHGGQMMFHKDGYLWVTTGEANAAYAKKQDQLRGKSVLGALLRIDVSQSTPQKPYRIPADNPFVGNKNGIQPEIWAYGFRNPWRFTINSVNDMITVGDVGDNDREEINVIEKGKDYGWPVMEAELCWPPNEPQTCNKDGIHLPRFAFSHEVSRSIVAGVIYDGKAIPELRGRYVFGDYLRGLYATDLGKDPQNEFKLVTSLNSSDITLLHFKQINLYGEDRGETTSFVTIYEGLDKEIYLADLNGVIYQMVPASLWFQIRGFLFQLLSFK